MALSRTWYNTLVDDDGSNTVGSIWDKAAVDHIYDDVDLEIARLDVAGSVVASTVTGTQNNYAPTLSNRTLIEWAGAADATFTGLAGGAVGKIVTFKNTGSFVAYFAHQHASSSAGNKFRNFATSASTPIAATGAITFQYDGTDWQIISHEQGAWITPTFSAANFTASAGTWTVDAGDVLTDMYRLSGRTLHWQFAVATTSVSTTPTYLQRTLWGFTSGSQRFDSVIQQADNGATQSVGYAWIQPAFSTVLFGKFSGNWAAATNNTTIITQGCCAVA